MKMTAADRYVVRYARENIYDIGKMSDAFCDRAKLVRRNAGCHFNEAVEAATIIKTSARVHQAFAERDQRFSPMHGAAYSDADTRRAMLTARRKFDLGRDEERHADACDRLAAALALGAHYGQGFDTALKAAGYTE